MPALHHGIGRQTYLPLLSVIFLVALAGCTGVTAPGPGDSPADATTTVSPPLDAGDAEQRAQWDEREYVFENEVPADATASGTGGISTTRSTAVAATDDGWFVDVRFAYWYNQNTSDGELHADGVTHAAYFVTPNDTTRVSIPGDEMKGSGPAGGDATLQVQVVNADDAVHDVALSIQRAGAGSVFEGDMSVPGRSAIHTPRLPVPVDTYEVVTTVDGETVTKRVTTAGDEDPRAHVTVFVAPDGTVVITQTPGRR